MALQRSNNKYNFTPVEKAILTTILYSDIFHFPLRKEELWRFLIYKNAISKKAFMSGLQKLARKFLICRDDYYCLAGKSDSIDKRERNSLYVQQKTQFAQKIAKKLSVLPTIVFVGISGSVAAKNVKEKDDIDFFVITKSNTLFVTRFFITILLEVLRVRRRRDMVHSRDKICVNLLVDESAMCWSEKDRNVYTAREIAQIVPLFERNNCYQRFLACNNWVSDFMPNALKQPNRIILVSEESSLVTKIFETFPFPFLESPVRYLQLYYMKRHRTREVIQNNYLGFHPVDYGAKTLAQLNQNLQQFGLLTID